MLASFPFPKYSSWSSGIRIPVEHEISNTSFVTSSYFRVASEPVPSVIVWSSSIVRPVEAPRFTPPADVMAMPPAQAICISSLVVSS